jgi:hypothetical protein
MRKTTNVTSIFDLNRQLLLMIKNNNNSNIKT